MEMYCDVVPVYHSESLRQFPQISAITYNNFFYLAHECLTLGLVSVFLSCVSVEEVSLADLNI